MEFFRSFYYWLSPNFRRLARRIFYFPGDLYQSVFKNNSNQPPKGLIYTGSGDYVEIGLKYRKYFIELCGLKPDHHVLDIGSGIGRMALPFTDYLNDQGKYEGFDIVKAGVDWCTKNITSVYPNFKFTHIDLENELYNLDTEFKAKNFIFPYENESFDLVLLTSVFTHMVKEDVENYMTQIYRVLKNEGRCLMTFFILNKDSKNLMQNNNGIKFKYDYGDYSLMDKSVKEANIAYDEMYIRNLLEKNNLSIKMVNYGFWCDKSKNDAMDFQDIVIVKKGKV